MTLNLKSERGRALFERLATSADDVVDDVGPGAVERIRELEERVARTEQEMAELRQLLERQRAERVNVR